MGTPIRELNEMDLIEIARYHDYNQEDTFLPKHIEGSGAGQTIHELLKVIFKQRAEIENLAHSNSVDMSNAEESHRAEIADLKSELGWHQSENERLTDRIKELEDLIEYRSGARPD